MSVSGNFDTHLENGGAAQKKSMREDAGGVCGGMVERSQRESFESFGRTNTRLLEVERIRRVSSIEISQPFCVPFRVSPQSHWIPATLKRLIRRAFADRSVNVEDLLSYNHLSSPFLKNSHNV